MSEVNILVAVDVQAAIASGDLSAHLYMVDTNGSVGSYGEGGNELVTQCHNGDTIVWSVVPIDPDTDVAIHSFSGQAIPNMVNPAPYPQYDGSVWGGRVNQAGTRVQYSMTLLLGGRVLLGFDPFITATNYS